MRCRRSLLTAVGCCCCCHRCCQRLVVFPISMISLGAVTASCPSQAPPPNPIAAEPDGRRVLSGGGVADHAVTPEAPLTGSGCREYSYGGFGGGHPHFHPHAILAGNPRIKRQARPRSRPSESVRVLGSSCDLALRPM